MKNNPYLDKPIRSELDYARELDHSKENLTTLECRFITTAFLHAPRAPNDRSIK